MNLKKLLVVDIETAGIVSTLDDLYVLNKRMHQLWIKRSIWLRERYPENKDLDDNELWQLKSGLHPEFSRVVCVTLGSFSTPYNELKYTSFYGEDEHDILFKTNKVLNNAFASEYTLAGHTIERFDIPVLWKRMLINKIRPSNLIMTYDKKPWDLRFLDISKFWSGGAWQEGFTSLDTMSALFDIESPKDDMQANRVHTSYYNNEHEAIKTYCESDVRATMLLINEFADIVNPVQITQSL